MHSNLQHLDHVIALRETGFWGRQGAGCLIFANNTGKFLVAFRSSQCMDPQTYGTIGGAIDDGEDPAEAMKREVLEECGYAGKFSTVQPLHVFSTETKAGTIFKYHNFLVVVEEQFNAPEHWETEHFAWVSYKQLLEIEPKHFGLKALLEHSGHILSSYGTSSSQTC